MPQGPPHLGSTEQEAETFKEGMRAPYGLLVRACRAAHLKCPLSSLAAMPSLGLPRPPGLILSL